MKGPEYSQEGRAHIWGGEEHTLGQLHRGNRTLEFVADT